MNCIDCEHHKTVNDRDPDDWFCDDDVAIVCTLTPQTPKETRYMADRAGFKPITVACRPYNARKESPTPQWCPLGLGGKAAA